MQNQTSAAVYVDRRFTLNSHVFVYLNFRRLSHSGAEFESLDEGWKRTATAYDPNAACRSQNRANSESCVFHLGSTYLPFWCLRSRAWISLTPVAVGNCRKKVAVMTYVQALCNPALGYNFFSTSRRCSLSRFRRCCCSVSLLSAIHISSVILTRRLMTLWSWSKWHRKRRTQLSIYVLYLTSSVDILPSHKHD